MDTHRPERQEQTIPHVQQRVPFSGIARECKALAEIITERLENAEELEGVNLQAVRADLFLSLEHLTDGHEGAVEAIRDWIAGV